MMDRLQAELVMSDVGLTGSVGNIPNVSVVFRASFIVESFGSCHCILFRGAVSGKNQPNNNRKEGTVKLLSGEFEALEVGAAVHRLLFPVCSADLFALQSKHGMTGMPAAVIRASG
jgi:hypothetical protein